MRVRAAVVAIVLVLTALAVVFWVGPKAEQDADYRECLADFKGTAATDGGTSEGYEDICHRSVYGD